MSNLIKIIGTGKHLGLPKGFVHYEVPEMAELLVNCGRAVYEGTPLEEEKEKVQAAPESKKQIKKPTTKKSK
jgi:hypothetical protein